MKKIILTSLICSMAIISFGQSKFDYNAAWKKVDEFSKQRLTESMIKEVDIIYKQATTDKLYPEQARALKQKVELTSQLSEDGYTDAINWLKVEESKLSLPTKAIAQNLLSQFYSSYYNSNRWSIADISTVGQDEADFKTWSVAKILDEVTKYALLSVSEKNELRKFKTEDYKLMLLNNTSKNYVYRPTLYDFLVGEVIDLFNRDDFSVHKPIEEFVINETHFVDYDKFISLDLKTADSSSLKYQTLKLYQEWLNENKNNSKVLIPIEINRLRYLNTQFKNSILFEKRLHTLYYSNKSAIEGGDILYEMANIYYNKGKDYQRSKNKADRYALVKALELAREVQTKYPDSEGAKIAKSIIDPIERVSLGLTIEKFSAEDTPIKYKLDYINTNKVNITVYKISLRDYNLHLSDYQKKEKVYSEEFQLPINNDYQPYSVELPLSGLKTGFYLVEASSDVAKTHTKIQISNITTIQIGDVVEFRDRTTGEVLPDVKVSLYKYNPYHKQSFTNKEAPVKIMVTDSEGKINIKNKDQIVNLRAVKGKDELFSADTYSSGRYNDDNLEVNTVKFFTDRAIYRPGQTVYFKGLAINKKNNDSKVIENKSYTISLLDVNYQKVSSVDLKTNNFGSFNGSFTIPQNLLNGNMTILTGDNAGATTIRVEEYKRPTFEVKIEAPEKEIGLNSPVKLKGTAKSLAGYSVDAAKVQYRVERVENSPYRWWFPPIHNISKEIANGITVTNENGNFEIPFITEEGDDKNPVLVYTYTVTANITDPNGETQSTTYSLQASRKPLLIKSEIPQLVDVYSNDSKLSYKLQTETLNGKEVESELQIEIYELETPDRLVRKSLWETPDTFLLSEKEFEGIFPLDDYNGEYTKSDKYTEGAKIASFTQNTFKQKNIDLSIFKQKNKEWYRVKIKAKSKQGITTETQQDVRLMSLNVPISNMDNWLQTIKTEVKVNENATFLLSGYDEGIVYYTAYDKNNTEIKKGKIQVSRSPKELIIPVKEELRGGIRVYFSMVQHNRVYAKTEYITVPWDNKELNISFNTFRDKLQPGGKEKWQLTVKDKKGDAVLAEMVASLYDASLDAFTPLSWMDINEIYQQKFAYEYPSTPNINVQQNVKSYYGHYSGSNIIYRDYPRLYLNIPGVGNPFGDSRIMVRGSSSSLHLAKVSSFSLPPSPQSDGFSQMLGGSVVEEVALDEVEVNNNIGIRTNFNETAFFYPEILTNEKGEVVIEFTIPEALTRWKMLGFAHTKDLKVGNISNELITQKEIAISANAPRFVREGDKIQLTAKINNIQNTKLVAETYLQLYDAINMESRNNLIKTTNKQKVEIGAEQSTTVTWTIEVPEGLQALTYRVYADAGKHTDGEEKTIPVLLNRMLVTETMPFMVKAHQEKEFTFEDLQNKNSKTLRNHNLTLEFTSNPAWYAVQSLPYIMEYPHECSEQTFSRFFSNTLASTIVNSKPQIKRIFDLWSKLPDSEAFQSKLEKNQELKQVILEETPWVLSAQNESEQKKRVGLLFDLNKLSNEADRVFKKLSKNQNNNGGFPWFKGGESSRYITQHIVTGFAKLNKLNALSDEYKAQSANIVSRAIKYLDKEYQKDYNNIEKEELDQMHVSSIHLHYLYSVLYNDHVPNTKAYNYYKEQAFENWTKFEIYEQGLIALIAHKTNNNKLANNIVKSLKERAIKTEDRGMFWNLRTGYYWNQSLVETQTLLIDVFNQVVNDSESIEEMKLWLLLNKQTTHWRSTKATTEAIYALLLTGQDLISETKTLKIEIANKNLQELKPDLKVEPGTGYAKTSWSDFDKSMANIKVKNENNGAAFGGMYWQYFENLDKIESSETNLKIKKDLYIKKDTEKGQKLVPINKEKIRVGDVITVRMELRADRNFEYVHIKDTRASSFEPTTTLSGYKYKNGLGYYENIKDASTNFFINYLPKGTHVFEYDLRVTHKGEFSNGITTFQCMYAPEFSSHSQGVRIKVE